MKRLLTVRCEDNDRERIKAIARGDSLMTAEIVKTDALDPRASANITCLLDDVERLTKEVAEYAGRLERCARATEDDKVRYWINQCDVLKAHIVKLEGDGS